MRVISGSAKGIQLASVPGKSTRPITDRVKEALFNIIGMDVIEKYFLDLFGGTGAVGIEALSRGADHATFLEVNYRAYKVILQNLKTTELIDYGTVLKKDAFAFLREEPTQGFDYIYIAPPQYQGLWIKTMNTLDENPTWSAPGGEVIVQIHPKELVDEYGYANFTEFDQRSYGDTMLIFYKHTSAK
jgi:16S rRNA (guanine966-N2)-methyltransferase